ncbi:MAG TPA: glycosyltransferase family 39 protein [Acidobacteriaceae bacterium]|nr:glycosyltransferase family 39 protein [Acidobacteriaceae bacterium]
MLAAILISRPFVEMGLIDDFSYVKTAFIFAHTGHFVFNGWATAMLGAQIVWAAPFIKLLGDSFFATRVSTVVLATLCVWVTHAVFRRVGLERGPAALGALTLGLSPLFVPMAVSFMTDISGLIAIVACIYCCLRAMESSNTRAVLSWLVLAEIVGLLGGTTRQIAWVTVLAMVPSAAWILRRRRGVLLLGVALWLVSVAFIGACMWWFKHQPFNVPELLIQHRLRWRDARELAGTLLAALLCLCLVLMPALAAGSVALRRMKWWQLALLLAGSIVAVLVCRFITYHLTEKGLLPWTGDIIDKLDVFDSPNAWLLGVAPTTLGVTGRAIGSAIVLFTTALFVVALYKTRGSVRSGAAHRHSWRDLITLFAPFTAAYLALLIPRGIWAMVIDRYLLPLIVIALIFLLRLYQERVSSTLPWTSWVVLFILGAFTVLGTHDWIASHRARLQAVQQLERAGIPRSKIEAGYEFDGMTQIDLRGVVIDPRVHYPPSVDTRPYRPAGVPPQCKALFNPHTPAVHPELFLAYEQVPCLGPSRFDAVSYRGWMPPFHREILILQRVQ